MFMPGKVFSDTISTGRVEILPVKIKLDYKPKRVDYKGLRQGKAIELMNFFHFEGSEMTLRHMTLTGVCILYILRLLFNNELTNYV